MDMVPPETLANLPEMEKFNVELKKDAHGLGITIAGYVCEKGIVEIVNTGPGQFSSSFLTADPFGRRHSFFEHFYFGIACQNLFRNLVRLSRRLDKLSNIQKNCLDIQRDCLEI